MSSGEQRVFVTNHACEYLMSERTELTYRKLVNLLSAQAYICLGTTEKGIEFLLVWDEPKETGIVLITKKGFLENEIKVISVWPITFDLPYEIRRPTSDDLAEVCRLSEGIPDTYIRPQTQT